MRLDARITSTNNAISDLNMRLDNDNLQVLLVMFM